MSRDPAALASRILAQRAAAVPPPAPGLAAAARRRARVRRRNQALAGVVVAAAVAVAVLAPGVLPGGHRHGQDLPARRSEVPLTVPGRLVTRIAPDALPEGTAPRVAWTTDAVLHRSDGRALSLPIGPVPAVETSDGGAFVPVSTTADSALRRVAADGTAGPARNASWPVVGRRGQLGYLDRGTRRLVTVLPSGATSAVPVPFDVRRATLVGWLGDQTVVANVPGHSARLIGSGATAVTLPGRQQATATDGRTTLASRSADGACLEVRRSRRLLWRSCGGGPERFTSVVAFSPDSRHALVRRGTTGGAGDYAVVDTETGSPLRLFTAARAPSGAPAGLGQAVFESDSTVLVAVSVGPGQSIVRCTITGACEVAVAHADMPRGPAGPHPFDPAWVP